MTITRRWQSGWETNYKYEVPDIYIGWSVEVSTEQKNTGSYSLRMTVFHSGYANWADVPISATRQVRTGFFIRLDSLNTSGTKMYLCVVKDASNNILLGLREQNGNLYLTVNGTDQDTEVSAMSAATWTHFGLDTKIDSSAGWCKVYKDGVEILSFSGNTGNADVVKVTCGTIDIGGNIFLDDWYVDDTTGESSAAALPVKKFYYATPNGNGNYSQWDGSDGNSVDNYALVDEVPPNSDTDYVYNYVADELDSYAMTTITLGTNESVSAVIPTAYIKRASTTEQIALGTRYNSTDSIGSDQNPALSYGYLRERQTTKPGGGAWDQTSIDGMEVVIKARGTY